MRLFSDIASAVDDPHLARAFALAEQGRGRTAPNPCVGCVIVRDGSVVGEGSHPGAGHPHAEVLALRSAGDRARGADVYVTLEPCAHHGRTPPCADALVEAGVSRVVIGMPDPSAEAAGGASILRDAGIGVDFSREPDVFRALNEGWLKRLESGRPFVTVKVAVSLDGHPSGESGRRSSITGESGAVVTARLRSMSDAVLVGAATVAIDDPVLTRRDAAGTPHDHQPVRVVLTRSTLPAMSSRLFTDGAASTWLLAPRELSVAEDEMGAEIVRYPSDEGLTGALGSLGARGVNDLLVEAGPRLLTSLWSERLIDRLVLVTAGGMAGAGAPVLFEGAAEVRDDALLRSFVPEEACVVGDVIVGSWRPRSSGPAPQPERELSCSRV